MENQIEELLSQLIRPLGRDVFGELTSHFLNRAVVAVLWEMVCTDCNVEARELDELDRNLNELLELTPDELEDFSNFKVFLRGNLHRFEHFLEAVSEQFSYPQKELIFNMAWRIAQADCHFSEREKLYALHLRRRLAL